MESNLCVILSVGQYEGLFGWNTLLQGDLGKIIERELLIFIRDALPVFIIVWSSQGVMNCNGNNLITTEVVEG